METKPCSACKTAKPRSEFYADRTKSTGLSSRCKRCYSDIHRLTYNGDRRAASIAKARKQHLRTSYGITPEQFAELVESQNGLCALCDKPETVFHKRTAGFAALCVDHDHITGAVRGALCRYCNLMLGYIESRPEMLVRVAKYLQNERHYLGAVSTSGGVVGAHREIH